MKFELVHDTIARQVFEKSSADAKARRKAEAFLDRAYQRYEDRGVLLTSDDLEELRPYMEVLNIGENEQRFIRKSRRALRIKRRRNRIIALSTIAILTVALLIASITSFNLKRSQIALKTSNEKNLYNSTIFGTTVQYELEGNATKSLQTALQHPDKLEAYFQRPKFREVFFDAYLQGWGGGVDGFYNPFFRRTAAPASPILDIQYDETGQFQTAHQNGMLVRWDEAGQAADTLQVVKNLFTNAKFSDSKDRLAFFTSGGRIELLFLKSQKYQSVESPYGEIQDIIFAPETGLHATRTNQHTVELWDTLGHSLGLIKKSDSEVIDFQFSKDGQGLLIHTRGTLKDSLQLFTYNREEKLMELESAISQVRGYYKAATIDPQRGIIVFADAKGKIIPRRSSRIIEGSADSPIRKMLFLNQGKHLLAYTNKTIQIWDYDAVMNGTIFSSALSGSIPLNGLAIFDIIPLSDHYFALLYAGNTVKVYDIYGEIILETIGPESNVQRLASFHKGPKFSTLQTSGAVYNWFLPQSEALHPAVELPDSPQSILPLSFDSAATTRTLIQASERIFLFDYSNLKVIHARKLNLSSIGFNYGSTPDEFIVVYQNGLLERWLINGDRLEPSITVGNVKEEIVSLITHPNHRQSLIRTQSGKLWYLNPQKGNLQCKPVPTDYRFEWVVSSPGLDAIAGVTLDKKFVLLYGTQFKELPDLLKDIPVASITASWFSPNGKELWVGTEDGSIFRIRLEQREIRELPDSPFNTAIKNICMLEGRMLVVASESGQIRFIHSAPSDTSKLETITPEGTQRAAFKELVTIENRKFVLGYTGRGGVKVWRADGQLDMSFQLLGNVNLNAVAAMPNLHHILTLQSDGLLKVWHLHPSAIFEKLERLKILETQ